MSRWFPIFAVGLLMYAGYALVIQRPLSSGKGPAIDLAQEPEQMPLQPPESVRLVRDGKTFVIEKTHRYEVVGQVLSTATYNVTFTNDFFDVDLGLIWGPKREALLSRYKFYQDGRWLFWRADHEVSDEMRAYITTHISNNHLIPAEGRKNVAKAIHWAGKGDHVRLKGALVTIHSEDGEVLVTSSTSRTDSGGGACEVMWVDELQIGTKLYR